MGVTTQDIFGGKSGPQPALPGTYGEAPSGYRLPDATRLGRVVLQVADLGRSLPFYVDVLGFRTVRRDGALVELAALGSDQVLIELRERPGARSVAGRGRLGLFHVAILLPERASLGRFVRHLRTIGVRAGAGDHLVSEAFYLSDPDGLGIEVYADRPRASWQRVGRELMMATDPVDVDSLVTAAGATSWSGLPSGTTIGHVHLHVGEIAKSTAFYSGGIGFDRMVWSYPGALFLAAAGYHHHLGTNVWAGAGAPPAAEDEARLVEWTVEVPTLRDVDAVAASVLASVPATGAVVTRDAARGDAVLRDPWGTALRVIASS